MSSENRVFRPNLVLLLVLVASAGLDERPAHAQMGGMSRSSRSLGGYGASTIGSYYRNSGGGTYLPYNGRASGYVPYQSGGGMTAQPVSRSLISTSIGGASMAATPIGGASLSTAGGMRGSSMGSTWSEVGRGLIPYGYEAGLGRGMGGSMTRSGSKPNATPGPGFGNPFRMPTDLGGPSGMAMP